MKSEAKVAGTTPSSLTVPAAEARAKQPVEIPNRFVPYVEPGQTSRLSRSAVVAVAAGLMIGAVGVPVAAGWLRNRMPAETVAEKKPEQPKAAPVTSPAVGRRAAPPAAHAQPPKAVADAASRQAPAAAAVRNRRQTVASSRSTRTGSTLAKSDRQTSPSTQPAGTLAASPLIAAAPAQIAPAPATATEPPPFAAPVPPIGRLFEPNEVDEAPRVETRVEPQLPADLPVRPVNDIVVVRILVSQTGHPFRVGLLRRSRLGSQVDDRVIAAVRQWTFLPARKRGEPVSCWFNLGVSLKAD